MNRFVIFPSVVCSMFLAAQEQPEKLGFHALLDMNVGLDLPHIIRTQKVDNDYQRSQLPPGKFNYGFSFLGGCQVATRLSLSAGFRYSFIDPNFHLLYYKMQPNIYLGDPADQDFLYLFANFGSKLNQTAAAKATLVINKTEPLGKHLGHHFQFYLDDQIIEGEGNLFIGISYGIVLIGNKNL